MRAIHVADYYDDRIYFLVDKEDDHDGVIVRSNQEPIFVDLFSYMGKVSGDKGWKKITNTKFHDFLWYGQNGELANRWRRVFQEHSIEPRKELLLSVPVVTDFPEHQKRKKANEKRSNRASEFKGLLAAGLHEKALGRGIGRAGRRLARGGKFDPTPIDADLDMIVQEGTPWERPALPSVPDSPRRMERRARQQGFQSHRDGGNASTRGWKTRDGEGWRKFHKDPDRYVDISPKESRQILDAEHRAVEKAYSNGEPIHTRGELQAAFEKAHPGFADGSSEFDAAARGLLEEGGDLKAELSPIEREVGYALLEHLRLNPNLQDANLQVHSFRTRDEHDLPQVSIHADGWAMYEHGTLFDFDQNGELILKEDEKPTIQIAYKADTPLAENDHRRNDPDKKSPMANRMEDGKRYWDASLDAPFSPRADPKQSTSGAMDMMARRVYMSFMAELDEPHMMDSDQGWELDPTDNWYTPHTTQGVQDPRLERHVGVPRATRRKRKVRKQHEEATRHASANIAHHEFAHADHYMAMRKDLIAAIKKHVGEGGTTMEGLERFIREQLVTNMTDRQRRRALEAVVSERLARRFPKYVAYLNGNKTAAIVGMVSPETITPNGSSADLRDIRDRGRASMEGLIEHLKQPIMGADGEPILITDDIADFLNSHPVFTSSSLEGILDLDPEDLDPRISDRDAMPGDPVSAGESLTRQHLLNVFGSEHAYLDASGNPFAGADVGGGPQRTPLWAVTLSHDAPGRRGKYGGRYVQPLSGRSLIDVEEHQASTSSPSSANVLNNFVYTPDALEIMLGHGTPEIHMHGVVGSDPEMGRDAIIPPLSPEGARVLIDAMARTVGQIPDYGPNNWYKESLMSGGTPGRTLADIPPDTPPKIGKGRDIMPFLDEDLPAAEVGEALQELVEHWTDKVIGRARSASGDQREIQLKNISQYLEAVGRSAFHFDDLSEAEIDGIMDLLDDIGIESTLSGGRTVSWAPYMGWIDQRPNQAPGMTPLVNGMNARHHEFFAELGAALSSGLTIRPPVDSVQHTALKKVTAWLRRDQPFTAKVNIDTSRISRIHLPRDEYLRREELLQQGLEMERLARNTTKQEAHG
ncbi:MAG: hypothetical protein QF448_06885 [Candidatus Thalassarchaeaceae archaeon]|nr:hypothetical protein [Candidatus Thalassarchaeaceae archaeon]